MHDVNKPTIVLVLADQLSAAALPRAIAPNLERLGREGVVFERAYCASPLCVPSRAELMTGLLPSELFCQERCSRLPRRR